MARPVVLHLLSVFDYGGVEKRMTYFWAQKEHCRYDHRFAAIGHGGAMERQLLDEGARVACLGLDPRIPRLATTWGLRDFLRRTRPDVLHGHGPEPSFHGLLAGRLARIRVRVGEEFALPTYSDRAAFVFRQVYRTAHAVVCNCEAVRSAVLQRRIAPRDKTRVLLNPIPLGDEPPPLDRDPDYFTMVFVGRLVPHKNARILLPVLGRMRAEGIPARLWLVGDGRERQGLEEATAGLGLGDHVTFWGYRPDVEDILRKADVFVHTSLNDGSSLSIGEAMGCRLPVVSTDAGGPAELIDDGDTGYLVPPESEEALLDALRRVWAMGPEGRGEMGERARAAVIETRDPQRYMAQLEAVYDSLLSQRRGQG